MDLIIIEMSHANVGVCIIPKMHAICLHCNMLQPTPRQMLQHAPMSSRQITATQPFPTTPVPQLPMVPTVTHSHDHTVPSVTYGMCQALLMCPAS